MRTRVPSRLLESLLWAVTLSGPFLFGAVEPWARALLELLAFSLALAAFLRGDPDVPAEARSFWIFPAGIAALGALQLVNSVSPDGPRPDGPFTVAPRETEAAVLLWSSYACVAWAGPRALVNHEAARRYGRVLFLTGVGTAALGLLQWATGAEGPYWFRRVPGTAPFAAYFNRDHAANLMLMSFAVGCGVWWSRRKPAGADGLPRGNPAERAAVLWALALLLAALLATGSRGAFLAMPLAGAAVSLAGAGFQKRTKGRRFVAFGALAGAALVVAACFRIVGAAASAGGLVDPSIAARFFIYGDARRWLAEAPLFGTGLGSFATVYPAYQDLDLRGIVEHAHSDWLELTLEAGGAGLFAALTACVYAAWAAVRTWRTARSNEMRALLGGAVAAAAAFLAHSLFEFSFQIPANGFFFFGLAAFLVSAPAWADKAARTPRPDPPPAWAGAAALACGITLAMASLGHALGRTGRPDGRALLRTASGLYAAAGEGDAADPETLRAALPYALAAAQLRPFDASALTYAGGTLRKLGRGEDAAGFLRAALTLRFASPKPSARPSAPRTLEKLKTVGLEAPRRLP